MTAPRSFHRPELWQKAEQLFFLTLDQPIESRSQWLESQCAEQPELHELVRNLVHGDSKRDPFEGLSSMASAALDAASFTAGAQVGDFVIQGVLGVGGMGEVYRATRSLDGVPQEAALKLLRGKVSSLEGRRRFLLERQILAKLSHPGIARFLDAGSDRSGQPFVAMELIEGQSIVEYARKHRCSLRARIQLMLQVLDAVAYAHTQLIIHRDLKPSNVLVDQSGKAKLLDFGIAKLLQDQSGVEVELTATDARAFSLRYAAPEQILGRPVGVGCDVFALGSLLYELVCESPTIPLEGRNNHQIEQSILHELPANPSHRAGDTLPYPAHQLRGDLDRIILHALKKQPGERYAHVEAFAGDLRAWLEYQPISLRASVLSYRMRRYLRRNWLPVALAGSLFIALSASSLVLWQQQQDVALQRDRALSQQQRAEVSIQLLTDAFAAADPSQNRGKEIRAREILDQAARRLPEIELDVGARTAVAVSLAEVYRSIGLFPEAKALAEPLYESIDTLIDDDLRIRLLLVLAASYRDAGEQPQRDSALKKLALISTENAKLKVAVRTLDIESIADNGDTGRATSEARDFDRSIAAKYGATSEVAQMSGALYLKYLTMSFGRDEALAIANERLGQALDDDRSVQEWSLLVERARILTDLKRFAEAEADLRSVERIAIRLFGTESRQHAVALYQYARYFKVLGDSERELELTLRYVKILDRLYPEGYGMQAGLRNNLAAVYARLGRSKEALALSAEAVELGRKAFGDEHVNMLTFQSNHAKALFQNNQLEQADGLYRKVLARRYELSEGKLTGPVLELSLRYMQLLKAMGRSQEWQKLRAQLLQGIETDVAIPDQAEARRRVELSEQESGTQP